MTVNGCTGIDCSVRDSRALSCDPEIFVLVEDVVGRILVVLGDAEDADHPAAQIAVFVEGDFPLQGLDAGGLDGVPDRLARHLFARIGNALDRVEDGWREAA